MVLVTGIHHPSTCKYFATLDCRSNLIFGMQMLERSIDARSENESRFKFC